jgi:hypothetical protein
MRLRIYAIGLGLTLGVCFSAHAQDHSTFNGFWEARSTADESGGFSDAFGKVPKAPLRSDIKPLPRIMNAGAVYGGKMPVDGSACRRPQYFPFYLTSSPPFDVLIPAKPDGDIILLSESEQASRHVYMNAKHSEHVNPTRHGESVGHWEGNDLVIDTVGFIEPYQVPGGGRLGPNTHLVERYTLSPDGQKMDVTFTWEDPTIYTRPHVYTLHYYHMPKDTYAYTRWCDPGDPSEYISTNGVVVIGGDAIPDARLNGVR